VAAKLIVAGAVVALTSLATNWYMLPRVALLPDMLGDLAGGLLFAWALLLYRWLGYRWRPVSQTAPPEGANPAASLPAEREVNQVEPIIGVVENSAAGA
jgi:hypothetical protein